MKLKNSLYNIINSEPTAKGVRFDIQLNPEHTIYKAHFPGQPITPGVCIVQIAVELLEEHLNAPLQLKTAKNVKFLSVISPCENKCISYELQNISEEDGMVKWQTVVTSSQNNFAKLSLVCQK